MDLSNTPHDSNVIPKIIHFVWVGMAPKPELVVRCIESWHTHCPDYKIIEWGNTQLAKVENAYVREAAEAGKWAFVSDYLRLHALFEHGGFYFDSDLEVTAPVDKFRSYDFLSGFEKTLDGKRVRPITALMASVPGSPIIESLLADYEDLHFVNNGVADLTTNTDRITKHFRRRYGLHKSDYKGGEHTVFLDKTSAIFPYYFFCTPKAGAENFAVHHFNGSWAPPVKRKFIGAIGNWHLLKFTFKEEEEDASLPLSSGEKLVLRLPLPGKKKRAVALVRPKQS